MEQDQTPSAITNGISPRAHLARNLWTAYFEPFLVSIWTVLSSNYINLLLVFVPIGIVPYELGFQDSTIFVVEVLAIMPLGALISFAARSLTVNHEQSSRGLIRAASRNLVDVIVGWRHAQRSATVQTTNAGRCRYSWWLLSKAKSVSSKQAFSAQCLRTCSSC